MTKHYCCYGMAVDVGHDENCPLAQPQGEREAFEWKMANAMWRMYHHGETRNAASAQCEVQALGMFLRGAEIPAWGASPAVPVAQDEREGYEDMRLTLIGQVHELLDIAERHCWTDDAEEKRRTQGAIDYARKVTAPYNYNGRRAALSASTQPAVSAEALRLDWLEGWKGHLHIDYFLRDGKGAYILRDNAWGRALGNGPDLRAAIDAAMGTPPADNKENGNV